jgi:hypothetical protein
MSFAVVTNCFQEPDMLPQWIAHYEAQGAGEIRIAFDLDTELDDQAHRVQRGDMRMPPSRRTSSPLK